MERAVLDAVMEREPDFVDPERMSAFWTVVEHGLGHVWVGRFTGTSPWERHPADELIHVLEGSVTVTLHRPDGDDEVHVFRAGEVGVVPAKVWHKQSSEEGVVEWGLTPQPSEHCLDEVPPGP